MLISLIMVIWAGWIQGKYNREQDEIRTQKLNQLVAFSKSMEKTTEYIKSCLEAFPDYLHITSNSFEVNIADPKSLGFGNLVAHGLMGTGPLGGFRAYLRGTGKAYMFARISLYNNELYIFPHLSSNKYISNKFVPDPNGYFRNLLSYSPTSAECSGDESIVDMSPIEQKFPIKPFILKKSEIIYYCIEGDFHTETHISGSTQGTPNIKGAVVGGALAGTTGAIIGSQYKTNSTPISSSTVIADKRYLALYYNQNGVSEKIVMEIGYTEVNDALAILHQLLPDKDIQIVQSQAGQHQILESSADELLKYKGLLDQGIISQEEFEQKKKQLLGI